MKKMNNPEDVAVSIFDENGNLRSKEDFLSRVANVYDSAAAERENDYGPSLIDILCDPDAQVQPEEALITYDFLSRTIFISDEITVEMGTEIVRQIRLWNNADRLDEIPVEEREPIKIYIDTPGGDVSAVFNIISAIKLSKTPIHTITYGCGYSGGFFIGVCGHKRYGYPYSSYLFHEGMTIDGGDAHKFLQHVDFFKQQLKRLKDITISSTKITSEEYEEHKKDDWFFSPTEAVHYGIIDEILEEI